MNHNVRRRIRRNSYQIQKKKLNVLFMLIGILFILLGIFLHKYSYISKQIGSKMRKLDKFNPTIQVLCNHPNKEMKVIMETDIDGTTDITFFSLSNVENLSIWIFVKDLYAPFTWDTMNNATVVDITATDYQTYFSVDKDMVRGTGNLVTFRMDFGENIGKVGNIKLHTNINDYMIKNQENCWLRIPWINMCHDVYLSADSVPLDNSMLMKSTMNRELLYCLNMDIDVIIYNPAQNNKELLLRSLYPKGRQDDFHFSWKCKNNFDAQIFYTNEDWQKTMNILGIFASLSWSASYSLIRFAFKNSGEKRE